MKGIRALLKETPQSFLSLSALSGGYNEKPAAQ